MAAIRAQEWESESFWLHRITSYLNGEHSPRSARAPRAAFVAMEDSKLVGFVAGHLTRRLNCSGELQWINVAPEERKRGVGNALLVKMGSWFVDQGAFRVCVNVEARNVAARKLYQRHGAVVLNQHWMVWEDAREMARRKSCD